MSQQLVLSALNQLLSSVDLNGLVSSLPAFIQQNLGTLIGLLSGKRSTLNLQSILSLAQTFLGLLPPSISSLVQNLVGAALTNHTFDVQVILSLIGSHLQQVPQFVIQAALSIINNPSSVIQYLPLVLNYLPDKIKHYVNAFLANPQGFLLSALSLLPSSTSSTIQLLLGQLNNKGLSLNDIASSLFAHFVSLVPSELINIVHVLLGGVLGNNKIDIQSLFATFAPFVQQQIQQLVGQLQLPANIVQLLGTFLSSSFGNRASFNLDSALNLIQPLLSSIPSNIVNTIAGVISQVASNPLGALATLVSHASNSQLVSNALVQLSSHISFLPDNIQALVNLALSHLALLG